MIRLAITVTLPPEHFRTSQDALVQATILVSFRIALPIRQHRILRCLSQMLRQRQPLVQQ